jgi:isoleucyl-tRNA synthetase
MRRRCRCSAAFRSGTRTQRSCKLLQEKGALFAVDWKHVHSYMHCWRHKTPVILRATVQWFASMDKKIDGESLREAALRGIEKTRFYPDWGKARLHGMIANRPDWTLSRARQWGVPMPFFVHKETGALHPRTLELMEEVAKRVEAGGIEIWQTVTTESFLGADAAHYEKVKDTIDVWFDSGSTHFTVLKRSHAPRALSRPTSTSRAPTSTAAGSIPRCWCPA